MSRILMLNLLTRMQSLGADIRGLEIYHSSFPYFISGVVDGEVKVVIPGRGDRLGCLMSTTRVISVRRKLLSKRGFVINFKHN